jgi:hypothetical protein
MEFQTLSFGVGEIGGVAPFHTQERTSSTYPPRFSKQFLEEVFSETRFPVLRVLGNSMSVPLQNYPKTQFVVLFTEFTPTS